MGGEKRNFQKNAYYHIFNRGNNREQIFKNPEDKKLFINLLYRYHNGIDLYIDSYVVMDNHFHLILRTGNMPNFVSRYMQKICTSYAMNINPKYKRVGHIFQGRYQARYLRYKKDLQQARTYLKQNPIKEGYVKKGGDYPWGKFL